MWNNLVIDKKELFVQLFRIFEQEFLNILQYIAPIKINYNTSSNKVHELHLRICAEIENMIKEVAKDMDSDFDFESEFNEHKKSKLSSSSGEVLKSIFDKIEENEKNTLVDLLWWKKPDFSYFLSFVDEKIALCSKKIKFLADLELMPTANKSFFDRWFYIQPFEKKSSLVPVWRTNYNKVKHNKIENYTECTLEDLIYSISWYYLLLNYLIFWFDAKLKVEKIPFNDPTKWNLEYKSNNYEINTHLFEMTCCTIKRVIKLQNGQYSDWFWEVISNDEYEWIKDKLQKSIEAMIPYTGSTITLKQSVYCCYFDYVREIIYVWNHYDLATRSFHRRKAKFVRFVNKIK